jgi:hypothetical protein
MGGGHMMGGHVGGTHSSFSHSAGRGPSVASSGRSVAHNGNFRNGRGGIRLWGRWLWLWRLPWTAALPVSRVHSRLLLTQHSTVGEQRAPALRGPYS